MGSSDSGEAFREAPPEVDADAVSRVAGLVQIESVRLSLVHAEITVEPPLPENWAADAFVAFSPNLAGRVAERFTAHLAFLARWRADWSPSEMSFPDYDPEDPPGIELAAEFDLLYRLSHPEVITDEDLEHFCTLNATANAWPYWREIAQAMTTRMGVDAFVVPVLPVPRLSPRGSGKSDSPTE